MEFRVTLRRASPHLAMASSDLAMASPDLAMASPLNETEHFDLFCLELPQYLNVTSWSQINQVRTSENVLSSLGSVMSIFAVCGGPVCIMVHYRILGRPHCCAGHEPHAAQCVLQHYGHFFH